MTILTLPKRFNLLVLFSLAVFCGGYAQVNAQTLETEGVVGDMDRASRNPHLTVGVNVESNQVTILADAFHPSDEFKKYPIQFEFFVNRNLFSTQYRSVKLPGAVGVTIPSSVATVPFNYVVVAKVLHPNSVYTTVIEGAATADSTGTPVATLDCTLTRAGAVGVDDTIYTASEVAFSQPSDGVYAATFSAESQDGESTVTVVTKVTVAAGDAESSGTMKISEAQVADVEVAGGATVESAEGTLTVVTVTSGDEGTVLSCSK